MFKGRTSLDRFCSPDHAIQFLKSEEGSTKFAKVKAKRKRERIKAKKAALKTRGEWIKDLQKAFNKFIRLRDINQPCISCDKPTQDDERGAHGGLWDAGHYRSVGSCPALRFNENNVHKQCKKCNLFDSGKAVDYRIRLIKRIGLEAVEELEKDPPPLKLTIEEIKELLKDYRAKARDLERLNK